MLKESNRLLRTLCALTGGVLLTAASEAMASPYSTAVLADHPTAYWRLNETSGTTAVDSAGTFNGSYTNVALGQAGYNLGSDPSALAAGFGGSGINSFVGGMPLVFSSAGNATFSVETWVQCSAVSLNAGMVGNGIGGSEEFYLDLGAPGGAVRFFIRNSAGTASTANSTFVPDNQWHHIAGVCDETVGKIYLYIDGQLAGSANATNGIRSTFNQYMNIGARQSAAGDYDFQFVGSMSDVAVYPVALSPGQILNHYYAAGIPPKITLQPTNFIQLDENTTLIVPAAASGSPNLVYQWLDNQNSPVPGQTNASLVISNISGSLNGQSYTLTVSNAYGVATSSSVFVGVQSSAPQVVADLSPSALVLYQGYSNTYSVQVSGTEPFSYQWTLNGNPIAGQTNSSYTAVAVAGQTNNYQVIISNSFNGGSATPSGIAALGGIAAPSNPYAAQIVADHPSAYWRLDESGNATIANDYAGGHNGNYNNVQLGLPGFNPGDVDTAAGFDILASSDTYVIENNTPYVDVSAPAGSNANFTVEAWVNGTTNQPANGASIVAKGPAGGEEFYIDAGGAGGVFRFTIRKPGSGGVSTIISSAKTDGFWHHIVAVCDETGGASTLYVDTVNVGQITGLTGAGLFSSGQPLTIGAQSSASGYVPFNGEIDEVSVYNYAFTTAQIASHYNAVALAPYFTAAPPTNIVAFAGGNVTLSTVALGSGTLTNQWYSNNVAISGQVGPSLILNNLAAGTNTFKLIVSSAFGSATASAVVSVPTGSGPPQLVGDITPGSSVRYAGIPLTFSVSASGSQPLTYRWYLNNSLIAGATNFTYAISSLSSTNAGDYQVNVSNSLGTISSSVSTLTVIPAPTNVYPLTILLDHPVAYFRLDETNGATNGFDYVGGNVGQYVGGSPITPALPPYLGTNGYNPTYDSNTAAYFGITTGGDANRFNSFLGNTITNVDFSQPSGSSGAFSIEAWLKGAAGAVQDSGACIVAKGQGGAEQFALDINNGIRFYVRNAAAQTLVNAQASPTLTGGAPGSYVMDGKWHHVVGVCDQARSNLLMYVDGLLIGPNIITNGTVPALAYAYDLGHPGTGTNGAIAAAVGINKTLITDYAENSVVIGNRNKNSGHSNAPPSNGAYDLPFVGTIDEVALYGYALTPAQVATHYAVGAAVPLGGLTETVVNGQKVLTWLSAAQLQSAPDPKGPWATIPNATSPYTAPNTPAVQFYRLKVH